MFKNKRVALFVTFTFGTTALLILVSYMCNKTIENQNLKIIENRTVSTNKLFNLNFNYVHKSDNCDNDTLAIIIVTSYFGDVETRSAMRRTFTTDDLEKFKIRRVFLLGMAPSDKYTKQNAIENESKRFGDLIQGNFKEAYRNLTYKHIMGLKWVANHCYTAKYVIKMDDDIVINMYKVLNLLENDTIPIKNTLTGYVLKNMIPIREPANKWFVTANEYKNSTYPVFLSGWFYITTPQVCYEIIKESETTPYFWVDDVYVTGILANKLSLNYYNIDKYFTVYPEFLQCCIRDLKQLNYDCDILIGPNGGDNNLFNTFNNVLKYCYENQCKKREKNINETCVAERKINLGKGNPLISNYQLF